MIMDSVFRSPSPVERELLRRLLEADFPGRDELRSIIEHVEVKTLDEFGSLGLRTEGEIRSPVLKRVPVEAEAEDEDGVIVHVLLHVVEGQPVELEIFKEDGSLVKRMPSASAFEVMVLPPAPGPQKRG
jgi:hypothetical protein